MPPFLETVRGMFRKDAREMPFWEHLEELRRVVLRSIGALLLANVVAVSAPSLHVFTLVFLLQGVQLAALPYTTAIKGHVAIEYFFHKLGRRGRSVVDAMMRFGGMALFGLLAWGCVDYGNSLRQKGEVSTTLQLPIFWVPYLLAVSCSLVVLIKVYHLTHPGKPMIKP